MCVFSNSVNNAEFLYMFKDSIPWIFLQKYVQCKEGGLSISKHAIHMHAVQL